MISWEEFLKAGGDWIGSARAWMQRKKHNGSRVTWGSNEALEPQITVLEVEDIAANASWAAYKMGYEAAKKDTELQVRAFEEAKVKDLEALHDLLEVLAPFYLHAKALWNARRLVNRVADISKQGASSLVAGAFVNVIEAYKKWGDIADAFIEKPKNECTQCHVVNGIHEAGCCFEKPKGAIANRFPSTDGNLGDHVLADIARCKCGGVGLGVACEPGCPNCAAKQVDEVCGRILPTNVRCDEPIPCPHHGREFAEKRKCEPLTEGQEKALDEAGVKMFGYLYKQVVCPICKAHGYCHHRDA